MIMLNKLNQYGQEFYTSLSDVLGNVEFWDLKTNTLIKDRKWKYVYSTTETRYREVCVELDEKTYECIKYKMIEYQKEVWKDYDGKDKGLLD